MFIIGVRCVVSCVSDSGDMSMFVVGYGMLCVLIVFVVLVLLVFGCYLNSSGLMIFVLLLVLLSSEVVMNVGYDVFLLFGKVLSKVLLIRM